MTINYVTLEETTVLVEQGIGDVEHTHTSEEIPVGQALLLANKFNTGAYHPDVFVYFPKHQQVCSGNQVIGFIERQ